MVERVGWGGGLKGRRARGWGGGEGAGMVREWRRGVGRWLGNYIQLNFFTKNILIIRLACEPSSSYFIKLTVL